MKINNSTAYEICEFVKSDGVGTDLPETYLQYISHTHTQCLYWCACMCVFFTKETLKWSN
jgi:hypothetical protein